MFPIISIDGPAASGKSSVAQKVAAHLGMISVSSGELYRAVTWAALEAGASAENKALDAFLSHIRILSQERAGKVERQAAPGGKTGMHQGRYNLAWQIGAYNLTHHVC